MAAESCRVKRVGVHEAPAFKVDEGPVLVDKAEVRTKRPRSKSTKATFFSSLTLPMAVTSGCMAARQQTAVAVLAAYAPHGGRRRPCGGRKLPFKVDEGPVLVDKVKVRTKRPRSKPRRGLIYRR